MIYHGWLVHAMTLTFLLLAAIFLIAEAQAFTPPFEPRRVVSPRPAITDAPFIQAVEVTDQVNGNELVIGVRVNGDARAYPINMLTGPSREIINDTLGGVPIAATW